MCNLGCFQPWVSENQISTCLTNKEIYWLTLLGVQRQDLRVVGWFRDLMKYLSSETQLISILCLNVRSFLWTATSSSWGHVLCLNLIAEGWECVEGDWERVKANWLLPQTENKSLPLLSLWTSLGYKHKNFDPGLACADWHRPEFLTSCQQRR